VEESLRGAIAGYYRLGQLLAMPGLPDRPRMTAAPVTGRPLPLPGQPGFDPWCLTAPGRRFIWRTDPASSRAIDTLWRHDPDPAATLAIRAQLDAAATDRSIVAVADFRLTTVHFFRCPWSAIYLVYRPVVIAGQSLTPIQQFAFDVSAEPMMEGGGEFVRHLVIGPFHASSQVDYGDRGSGE